MVPLEVDDALPAMSVEGPDRSSGERNQEPSPEETDPQTPPPPPSDRVDLPTRPDYHPLPNASAPEPTPLPAADDDRDYERVGKMTYNWALALLSISVTLLLTDPHPVNHPDRIVLYAASTALTCLSLIAAVGLIFYSILRQPSAQLAKMQGTMMSFSAVTLVLAVLSRLALLIPSLLFLAVMASVIMLTGLLLLPIYNLVNTSN
ncbi:uncharacterized protein LOC141820086 [Curcuma longa]|uniref:uncharacterized protein LOC141820086 n=1 Tax=Curcuma longa TaxID=136217 RepID=UPI003D9E8CEC